MKGIRFNSLDEAFDCYGRENLIPIDLIKQQIFYAIHGTFGFSEFGEGEMRLIEKETHEQD